MTIILEARDTALIPLAHCEISSLNPRASVTPDEIDALAASIRTVGLMQNLAGLRRSEDCIEIVAGGRRLRALTVIAEQDGKQFADVLVPIIVTEDEAEARMWALSENAARAALHPAGEIAAYRAMAASGSTVADIAEAFAVTERHAEGRLRLAGLAQPILDALRADTITLDIAAAYTVSDDATAQLAVFEQVTDASWCNTPSVIRARLTREIEDATGKLARYVGREAYEAAGGHVREDLFGEDVWFLDSELLTRLATEKMETARSKHLAEGWKWAEVSLTRPDYEAL